MSKTPPHPPRWAQRFVEWYCRYDLAEDLLGDLNEYFERNADSKGLWLAKVIYIIDAIKFFRVYTVRKPKRLIDTIMIGSYIKTSGRNIARNKLFSTINIVGLAISMSVGLMLIAFLYDLSGYDRFHEKGSRIYRVISQPNFNNEGWSTFASTSVRAGKLIQEKLTGVDEAMLMRQTFRGDAVIGDKIIPVEAYWAEPSFFKIFSFPMIEGDPATALKEPYSIVLTQTSAKKLFSDEHALGKSILFDTLNYQVTGVVKDVPFRSHMRFEALVSFSTVEIQKRSDPRFLTWKSMWANYLYLLVPENADMAALQSKLDKIAADENAVTENAVINLSLQPLHNIVLNEELSNELGPTMSPTMLWAVGGLAFIVILSACFNYTNLSIARSLRRFKEVGLRKVVGASKGQVRQQFIFEAVIISFAALVISVGMFLLLRSQLINLDGDIGYLITLQLTPLLIVLFVVFSLLIGIIAGLLPAIFFSRVNALQALKDSSPLKIFRKANLRRVLVILQYTFTLMFITATVIGYTQYKSALAFNLGFNTGNILNIRVKFGEVDAFVNELRTLRDVDAISRSRMVTSIGNFSGEQLRYQNDSSLVWANSVDEHYIPLHGHQFVAGSNFITNRDEVIVNQTALKKFGMALGDEVMVAGKNLRVVGVLKDFHYGRIEDAIEPVIFISLTPKERDGFINVRLHSGDIATSRKEIEGAWKKFDAIHPFQGQFYDEQIENAYSEYSVMIKVVGFLAFLAISIASMGLFGMVVFTTETRLKEISIRKVNGAGTGHLIFILSRGFIVMLLIAATIALPATWIFFERVVLTGFPYHDPVGIVELLVGFFAVALIALVLIGSQTMKAARTNPAAVLKSE